MKNKRHTRRIKRLALICTLSTVILVVSTYAWFVGMKTVNVSSFDVEIAATDGLSLSLNGKYWSDSVTINKENYINKNATALTDASSIYSGATNTWGGKGLVPISTIGQVDATSSRLIMFEKGSLTTTPGGYRLMASRVKNETVTANTEEGNGYVAFDLFVRNLSGSAYYADYNQLNEEAIYLTQNSSVTIADAGASQDKTGIENSVRVAFAQIGRVEAEKDDENNSISDAKATLVQGIKCTGAATGVTAICDRYAQIWEPNDTKHVQNAINWYNVACKARSGADLTATGSYSGSCGTLANGTYSQTYAVGTEIGYDDKIDVYDSESGVYNTYDTSIYKKDGSVFEITGTTKTADTDIISTELSPTTADAKLYKYNYFRDTEKMLTGMDRPTFITLAPNSITKIRVYVYLEGQDVDNYDFASLGKAIKVNFGFTKERFYAGDLTTTDPEHTYDGPLTDGDRNLTVPTTPEAAAS